MASGAAFVFSLERPSLDSGALLSIPRTRGVRELFAFIFQGLTVVERDLRAFL